jgi:excisionase family DNA binding protein
VTTADTGPSHTDLAARFQILTAGEVAAVLRVRKDLIVDAIEGGELPGNRIGPHWRVDQALLTRWLYGNYDQPGSPTGQDASRPGG